MRKLCTPMTTLHMTLINPPPLLDVCTTLRAVQTQLEPKNPTKLPDFTQTEGLVGHRRVSIFKNQHQQVEWRVSFSKLELPNPTKLYTKSNQIQQDQANSGEISTKSGEILTRFSGI